MEVGTAAAFDLTNLLIIIVIFIFLFLGLLAALIFAMPYLVGWYKYRNREKDSLQFVLLQVAVPRGNETKIDAAEQLFSAFNSIKSGGGMFKFLNFLRPQPNLSFEIVALTESIRFYVSCHKKYKDLIEKQINGSYPDAQIKEVPEYNIFSEAGETAMAMLKLRAADYFPIKLYKELSVDPLSAITSVLARMGEGEGAAIQLIIGPAPNNDWQAAGRKFVKKEKDPGDGNNPKTPPDQKQIEAVENKVGKPGFNMVIRIVATAPTKDAAKAHLANIRAAFEQFNGPYNGFSGMKIKSEKGFIRDFVYRYQPRFDKMSVMASDELATIYHFPNKNVETPHIHWLAARSAPASEKIPMSGLYLGKSIFRGIERPVYIGDSDRQRHMYIIGRTGTGKSQYLLTLALQDVLAGKGLAFIDPHGDAAEQLLNLIPSNRAQDVIYWDPADSERPFGMNMLDFQTEEQKFFVVESIIGMLYKLYDPNHTGIIGPRLEHAVRNCLLTVMAVKGTLIEVVRALTDQKFVQEILPHVADPIVRRYWTDQIAQTTEFHKSETLDYFVSKFGKFVTNLMIRNIIGQQTPSFNMRQVMDQGKILIVNLSKGKMGEDNSNFLGLVLVPKILAAAMSRADMPEEQRKDFYLYVDEFQNFATDSFASIMSEARKYRLNLIVANQFIGQIDENIKNAIFGNVGTVMTYRVGVTDANFLQHEYAPVFSEQDLVNIEAQTMYVKTQVNGEPIPPFSLNVSKDMKAWYAMMKPEFGRAIKELSRLTYGRDKKIVEAEIAQRAKL